MATRRSPKKTQKPSPVSPLMVRLDDDSKAFVAEAAELRQMSMNDYVRLVTVPQARREVESARDQVIALTPDEQLTFWNALNRPTKLTAAQRRLAKLVRGKL